MLWQCFFFIMAIFVGCDGAGGVNDKGGDGEEYVAEEAIIYVSTAGDDSNMGTQISPVKTISKAVSMAKAKNNVIYVAKETYSELINITSLYSTTIKGGYNSTWTRDDINDKSTINGDNATASNTGRITVRAGELVLENLDIRGAKYNNERAYGIYGTGTKLTINNCDIVGVESGVVTSDAYAIYIYPLYNMSTMTIISNSTITINNSMIVGASGTATAWSAHALMGNGTTIINSGTIVGAKDSTTVSNASGFNGYGGCTINGGTIIGAADSATVDSSAYGFDGNGDLIIKGGVIVGATDNTTVGSYSCGIYNSGTTTINSGTIAGTNGSASVVGSAIGVRNNRGILTISGGTITGAVEDSSSGDAYGIESGGSITAMATISNCNIYAKDGTATVANDLYALYRGYGNKSKIYKGEDGPAIIRDIKGTDPNYWTNPPASFTWDTP